MDTLERIQKESDSIHSHVKDLLDNQLTNFNKNFTESKNFQYQLQTKIDTLANSLRQQTERLEEVSRSEAATTNNKALEEKLEAIEKKMQDQYPYVTGMLDGLTNRADQQSTTISSVAHVISETIKDDRSKAAKRMQQMTSDINSNQMAMTDIKNETTVLKKTISDYQISMGAALVKQQSKLSTLDSIVDRMDQVEKNVSYLKSKLEAMEPVHQLALKEIKNSITTGDKRPHEVMSGNGTSDDDSGSTSQIQQLDFKLMNLVKYMHQFKSTVLNPSFPQKLDDTLQEMEACLQ
jgi:chromosome segregation ATPase